MAEGSAELKFGFDVEALREKYRQERDKRLRPDGDSQYTELSGQFLHYGEDDPHAEPITRDPVHKER